MTGASLVAQMVKNSSIIRETWIWFLGWEDSPREGNSYPLQYSYLENSLDRGAWWATVQRVEKSRNQLSNFHFHYYLCFIIRKDHMTSKYIWLYNLCAIKISWCSWFKELSSLANGYLSTYSGTKKEGCWRRSSRHESLFSHWCLSQGLLYFIWILNLYVQLGNVFLNCLTAFRFLTWVSFLNLQIFYFSFTIFLFLL